MNNRIEKIINCNYGSKRLFEAADRKDQGWSGFKKCLRPNCKMSVDYKATNNPFSVGLAQQDLEMGIDPSSDNFNIVGDCNDSV